MIQIGLVGNGPIVSGFVDAVNKVEGIQVKALYLRPHNKGKGYEVHFGTDTVYYEYESLLEDESLDFIYIALPNSLHYPYAKQALEANKHVILEKPFTSNLNETNDLIRLAKEKKRFLFEAISVIHMPNFKYIKDALTKLGSISLVHANYSQYSSKYPKLLSGELPNVFNPDFSGGTLVDINYYNLYATVALFGMPKDSHYYAKQHENGVDLAGTLVLEYEGFVSVLNGAKDSSSMNYFQVQGDQGFINVVDGINGVSKLDVTLNQEHTSVNLQEEPNRLYYEVEQFVSIYQKQDLEACYKLLELSVQVMTLLDKSLGQIGLEYHSPTHI